MKKKIIIISILVVFIIALLLIPTKIYQTIFNREEPTPDNQESSVYQTLYVQNSDEYLVGIKVPVDTIEEDEVCQKWNLLTKEVNKIPNGYTSPIDVNTSLISHKTENNVLTLNLSEEFKNSSGRSTIECIAWNFCNDDVNEVVIKIEEEVINEINNYYYKNITKSLGVNLTYESAYLFEADYITIVHHDINVIKPVTYLFDSNNNIYDYTLKKIFNQDDELNELVIANGYQYTFENDTFVINIDYSGTLTDEIINTFTETVKLNFNVNNLVINGYDTVLLELSFKDITNS